MDTLFVYPVDTVGLYRWVLMILAAYLVTAYAVRYAKTKTFTNGSNRFLLSHVFDGSTMAGSVILLWGIVDPAILRIIGETTMFLMIGGVAGVVYSIHALFD